MLFISSMALADSAIPASTLQKCISPIINDNDVMFVNGSTSIKFLRSVKMNIQPLLCQRLIDYERSKAPDFSKNCFVVNQDIDNKSNGEAQNLYALWDKCKAEVTPQDVIAANEELSSKYQQLLAQEGKSAVKQSSEVQTDQSSIHSNAVNDRESNQILYGKFTYNTIALGQSYESFASNTTGYTCKKLNKRASECQPKVIKSVKAAVDITGRKLADLRVEKTRDTKLNATWSIFLNNQMIASKANLQFLDGKLVVITTMPWSPSKLMQPLLDKYGKPAEFVKRQHLVVSWKETLDNRSVKLYLSDEPSYPGLMIYDVEKSNVLYSTFNK